jgi:putative sigma-54 modulation protein
MPGGPIDLFRWRALSAVNSHVAIRRYSMQVNITGLHLEITEALRDYVEEKFERLERHFDRIIAVQVVLQVEKLRQKAEATLHVAGREVVANAEHEDMYASIDLLADKLDRQLIKHKEKQLDHNQGALAR